MLKKKDEILFIVPPTADQSATVGTGIVTGVDGDLATCSVFLSPVEARTVTVYATSGQAVEQTLNVDTSEPGMVEVPGFAMLKDQALMPMAVNEKMAARMIGFSVPFLAESRCNGRRPNRTPGPPYVKKGRAVRYLVADLHKWLLQGRRVLIDPNELEL